MSNRRNTPTTVFEHVQLFLLGKQSWKCLNIFDNISCQIYEK